MPEDFEANPELAQGAGALKDEAHSALLPIFRNRHGRPVRRSALSPLFVQSSNRISSFEEVVKNTVDFITANYSEDLSDLKYEIYDSPSYRPDAKKVRRWAVKSDQKTIVIYRLPIERFGQHRRKSIYEIRMSIEYQVFSAAAELIGRDPDFFLENR